MDSFEINKIVASILLIALLIIGIGKISDLVFQVDKPEIAGYKVEVSENGTSGQIVDDKTEQVEEIDISSLLALGDLTHGEKVFKKCSACHSINKGGENKIGPTLYNVLGRQVGGVSNYKYSSALVEYGLSLIHI